MGFFNPIAYFIRQFFRFLRSITGKLFIIFVLLFCVLILYMCIDKGVFAEDVSSDYIFYDSIFTSSNISYAQSLAGSVWNDTDYDIFLLCNNWWGNSLSGTGLNDCKCLGYWKVDNLPSGLKYIVQTDFDKTFIWNGGWAPSFTFHTNLVRLSSLNSDIFTASDINFKSLERNPSASNYTASINSEDNSWAGNSIDLYSPFNFIFDTYNNKKRYYVKPIRTHYDIVDINGNVIFPATNPKMPYIINDNSSIENWSFDYLKINSGSIGYVYYDDLLDKTAYSDVYLKYKYNGITYSQYINSQYIPEWSTDNFIVELPRTSLLSSVNIQNGESVEFYLEVKQQNVSDNIYYLGSYTFSLTTEEQEQIQSDSDKAVQGEILQSQQETNNKLDNLDNSINNDNVDDMSSDFGNLGNGMNAEDNTGIDSIFQKLYDAFCTDSVQSVSLTIPFVNKSFTIDTNNISNNFPVEIRSIVAVFVWGVIGLWVLKDIRTIIDKISEGSPEDVGSDVKKEVL